MSVHKYSLFTLCDTTIYYTLPEQDKIRSWFGMQRMPFSLTHNTETNFATKMSYFDVCDNLQQNVVVLYNCSKNATLNKNAYFTEGQKQRQRGRGLSGLHITLLCHGHSTLLQYTLLFFTILCYALL